MQGLGITISKHIQLQRNQALHPLLEQYSGKDTRALRPARCRKTRRAHQVTPQGKDHSEHKQEVKELREGYELLPAIALLGCPKISA